MNSQRNNTDAAQYKVVFSNIACRIKLTQQGGVYYIVIRLGTFGQVTTGKKSSKYSDKKPISSATLNFDNSLQIPFEGHELTNEFMRKDKCEIMLYRSKLSGERQSKELIGMASLSLGNQMFEEDMKRLKLTNSEDKQAFVQFNVKIQLGEADILSSVNSESKLSSFFMKMDEHSFVNELQQIPSKALSRRNESSYNVFKPNKKLLLGITQQLNKEDNQILELLNKETQANIKLNENENGVEQKSVEKIINVTQPTAVSEEVIRTNKVFQDERRSFQKICEDMQKQNQILSNKIQKLQHQLSNQNITSSKSINDRPPMPRPAGNIMKSSMIRKNNTVMNVQPQNQMGESSEIQKSSQIISQKSAESQKNQKSIQKGNNLEIKNVIDVLYKPPVNSRIPKHNTSSSNYYRENSLTNKSVSNDEKSRDHSYSKFNGKKKYQAIGIIKTLDQSQSVIYPDNSSISQSDRIISSNFPKPPLKQINSRKGSLDGLEKQCPIMTSRTQKPFLNFLDQNQKQESPLKGVLQPTEIKQNLNDWKLVQSSKKSRITLEQLDMKTEEKFRKNQRSLKIANMKILEENIQLKQEKKALLKQIEEKKGLTHEQFFSLKNEIKALSFELQKDKNSKFQNESKLKELFQRCSALQQENSRLKKQLKDQKIKYEYYFKISNINDHKEKEKEQNKKATHILIQDKIAFVRQDTNVSTSNLESARTHIKFIGETHNSDAELGRKRNVTEITQLKNVNFVSRDKSLEDAKLMANYFYQSQEQKPKVPKPSSGAVFKLKEQTITENKTGLNQNFTFANLMNKSALGSKETNFLSGFIGTGNTIIKN